MTTPSLLISIILITSFSNCRNENSRTAPVSGREDKAVSKIEINLFPAFNNYSVISIDKSSNTIQFKVDSTIESYQQGKTALFSMNLDTFRSHTLIDSFYSQSFLDSIKSKPETPLVRDGLSIFTVIKHNHILDTIDSGNVYPKILSTNILSQVDYILRNTNDEELKKYIKDLKRYFY
jgi:hypothetical protein